LLALLGGDEVAAAEHAEGATYAHRRTSREGSAVALALVGMLEVRRGRLGMAERRFSDACRTLKALGAHRLLAIYRGYQTLVLRIRGEEERAKEVLEPDDSTADVEGRALTQYVSHLLGLTADERGDGRSLHERLVVAIGLDASGDDQGGGVLHIEREGRWFQIGEGQITELGHRKPMRRILLGLAAARKTAPGEGLSTEAIFEAGWPGERATPESARNRVYVTIRRLRAEGLEAVLLNDDSGYFLDPSVRVA
ncbi:MAG: hypothetical protein QF464_21670, partial [Myxococcota bacterium]|nr:hypothetical protein [Myxococcota bacterium]